MLNLLFYPLGYIGPGAGFAFLGSFLVLLAAAGLVILSFCLLPLRLLAQWVTGGTHWMKQAKTRRVIVLGMDGLDPRRTRRMMQEGQLPNFSRLEQAGVFRVMQTTCPPMSPVAWSSFMTGVNPGKHNIFDFLSRNPATGQIELSSCETRTVRGRLPGTVKPEVVGRRRSRPFWAFLGKRRIPAVVLRVPITYPPEPFRGALLSAMCTPDLRGSQGSFTLFDSTAHPEPPPQPTGGILVPVTLNGGHIVTALPGPPHGRDHVSCPLQINVNEPARTATVTIGKTRFQLHEGRYSPWITVRFACGRHTVQGICRMLLCSISPEFRLYVTPINLDPTKPAMPVSHPKWFAWYLAKLHGPFATLGLAEDTWALNEGILTEEQFVTQTYDIHAEREAMLLDLVKTWRKGLLCCVFDLTDRIQHMFLGREEQTGATGRVTDAYRCMDRLLGKVMAHCDQDTTLLVLSDHGFSTFRRGVNLNAWLQQEGFLAVKQKGADTPYLKNIDWSGTRAYAFGLSGIYLNLAGREHSGIVPRDTEADALKAELTQRLLALRDPQDGKQVVHHVYDSATTLHGPYVDRAPDLLVGFADGYRVSWETAVGRTDGPILADNEKAWQGDHCLDAQLVPAAFFANRPLTQPDASIHITDLAPTILDLFGLKKPRHMDGNILYFEHENRIPQT